MTTTPKNIDFNGLQINSLDNTTNIITTMDGTNKGLSLNYDLLTIPKLFTLTINGFTFGGNTSSFSFVCFLQQLLQAVRIPPNATTLLINNTFKFVQGSHTTTFTISSSPSRLTIDVSTTHHVNFLTNVRSSILPSNIDDLVNKQYCDNLVSSRGNVTNINTGAFYLLFGDGSTIGLKTNLTDPTSNLPPAGFQYTPGGGGFITSSMTTSTGNSRIRFGGQYTTDNFQAHSVFLGSGWCSSVDNTALPTQSVIIGFDAGRINPNTSIVIIGNKASEISSNVGGLGTTASNLHVSIGHEANNNLPNKQSVAIGARACFTKTSSQTTATSPVDVSIGFEANYSSTGITGPTATAIGYRANYSGRADNTISINATGVAITNTTASSFQVAPIRGFPVGGGIGQLFYDLTGAVTGQAFEIYYSTT